MRRLLFLFILIFGSPLRAQTPATPEDSLEKALPSSAGQVRADLLNKLKEQERHESKIKIAGMQAEFEEENRKKLEQLKEQKRNQARQLSRQKTMGNFLIVPITLAVGLLTVLLSFIPAKKPIQQAFAGTKWNHQPAI